MTRARPLAPVAAGSHSKRRGNDVGVMPGLYYTGHMDGVPAGTLGKVESESGQALGLLGIGSADAPQLQIAAVG
jgi:hypothetical protein